MNVWLFMTSSAHHGFRGAMSESESETARAGRKVPTVVVRFVPSPPSLGLGFMQVLRDFREVY